MYPKSIRVVTGKKSDIWNSLPFHAETSKNLKTFKDIIKIRTVLHVVVGCVRVDLD